MPRISTKMIVAHRPDQMFDLVADVEKYPEFVPMCEALVIRQKREKDDKVLLVADMTAGYKLIRETFTSQVLLDRNQGIIDVKYIDGPFKHLENRWTFSPQESGEGCDVDFYMDYEFKNRMLTILVGSVFDMAFQKMTSAFEKRADEIYGNSLSI
ncbi:type II toxin-antitoxin system RatA family toxin [Bartonella sp. HY329]|uniref:type II toxin-antitoxin system RatA family toxin n=1 Tax=unclassified Bartonella TaxID=2645622 RepID=UPI0021C814E9|nr:MULTISPECIES: type II toxin-antitoxin system RatA family toxin [unclassified Bartonella]UXM94678.1 type II toxin-antitoxin system RatA family toxin [Bartonella sp. HY329]UXN09001.1 type II toxin-antitoxin system RatA family toxin [Bartonella sp. HY328]